MVVSLYTSRVVLNALGVEDYGIYQTVGGVVAMIGFLIGALSAGTSRFLTYELGTGNFAKLQSTFSSLFYVHLIFALIILLLGETIGLWFVYNKLVIPEERMFAAMITFHFSIATSFFTITQVPYDASIISHEKMRVYAYTSIVDAVLKLVIVFMLLKSPIDKLIYYSMLLFVQSVGMMMFYRWYCIRNFIECKLKFIFNKSIIKDVLTYCGWNVFATTSVALCSQGLTIVTNIFFQPEVVAARAVANTVNQIANQFVGNFRTAINPQIVKQYAAGNNDVSKDLLLSSTKYSFYLFYLFALPICLTAEFVLKVWLGKVPEFAIPYLQLAICTSIFGVFDVSFYTALYAKGRIKENSICSSLFFFIAFVATYLCFRGGLSPIMSGWMLLAAQIVVAVIVKPIILVKIVKYNYREILDVFKNCLLVAIVSTLLPLILYAYKDSLFENYYIKEISICVFSIISVGVTVWIIGLEKEIRTQIINVIKSRIIK